jgi:hypothetical protein
LARVSQGETHRRENPAIAPMARPNWRASFFWGGRYWYHRSFLAAAMKIGGGSGAAALRPLVGSRLGKKRSGVTPVGEGSTPEWYRRFKSGEERRRHRFNLLPTTFYLLPRLGGSPDRLWMLRLERDAPMVALQLHAPQESPPPKKGRGEKEKQRFSQK